MIKVDVENKEKVYIEEKVSGKSNFDSVFYKVETRLRRGDRVIKHPNNNLSYFEDEDAFLFVYKKMSDLIDDLREVNNCVVRIYG